MSTIERITITITLTAEMAQTVRGRPGRRVRLQ